VLKTFRLYKYLPFNEGSLKILTEGTIKFTKPSDFNDPFDCDPEHDAENIDKYLETRPDIIEKVLKIRNAKCKDSSKERKAMKTRLKIAIENGHFGQEASNDVGICSLTRNPLNLLMWAHYALNHTGFVVEFEIPLESFYPAEEEIKYFEWLIPQVVQYEKTKPVVYFDDDKNTKMSKQFLVKGKDWEYEKEERVIDYIRKSGIHRYDRNTILKSVFAGMRMNSKDNNELKEAVFDLKNIGLNVDIYRVKLVKRQYAVYIEGRPDLKTETIS
jgi:hypothetical protein